MKEKAKGFVMDVLCDALGGIIFAVGIACFVGPAQIAPGGVSGLSILVNYLTGLPVGTVNLGFNIPLLLLAWCFLGRVFTLRTLRSVFIQSVMIDLVSLWLPAYTGERIMAALFGGVAVGAGLALVFMRGSTTGGTDIVSRLIQRKYRHFSIGKLLFFVDVVVLALSVAVFRNIETGLYGMISIYTSAKVLDGILYGLDTGKVLLVISERHREIANRVMEQLGGHLPPGGRGMVGGGKADPPLRGAGQPVLPGGGDCPQPGPGCLCHHPGGQRNRWGGIPPHYLGEGDLR